MYDFFCFSADFPNSPYNAKTKKKSEFNWEFNFMLSMHPQVLIM